MDRKRPSWFLPRSPLGRWFKVKLALGLAFLMLFSGYEPTLSFPPLKKSIIFAVEEVQVKTIQAESTGLTFQHPHPGYLSTRFSTYHPGVDLATGLGMPVKPIAKGVVVTSGYSFWGLGLVVEIDHGEGYKSLYAHMGQTYVKPGQLVDTSNLLGSVGMTGNTSGPHTHLEIYKDGVPVNPAIILPPLREQPEANDFIVHNTGGKIDLINPLQNNQPQKESTPSATTPSPIVIQPVIQPQIIEINTEDPKPTPIPTPKSITKVPLVSTNISTPLNCKISALTFLSNKNCKS